MQKPSPTIRPIRYPDRLEQVLALLLEMNPRQTMEELAERYQKMDKADFRMIGLFLGEELAGISGFWIGHRFWCGKYLDVDNFIVKQGQRGKGHAQTMMAWLVAKAQEEGVNMMVLDVYTDNERAVRFYEKNGFIARGFHMLRIMNPDYSYIKSTMPIPQ